MKSLRNFFGLSVILLIGFGFFSCDGDPGPCEDLDCGIHGTCIENGNNATCECETGWEGTNCDVETDGNGGGPKLVAEILIKKKFGGNFLNNEGCLLVLGSTQESMGFFKYYYNEQTKKFDLRNRGTLESEEQVIFTAYSEKDKGENPNNDQKTGAIEIYDVPVGTYYMHVFDPSGDKYVSQLVIPNNGVVEHIAEVQPLSTIKVKVSLTSVQTNDTEINGAPVLLLGTGGDTLRQSQVKNADDALYEPYYQGVTSKRIGETGEEESGIVFFWDVPTRNYLVMGFNEGQFEEKKRQAFGYTDDMGKNVVFIINVCWEGCD